MAAEKKPFVIRKVVADINYPQTMKIDLKKTITYTTRMIFNEKVKT